jgi:hypothetical protein
MGVYIIHKQSFRSKHGHGESWWKDDASDLIDAQRFSKYKRALVVEVRKKGKVVAKFKNGKPIFGKGLATYNRVTKARKKVKRSGQIKSFSDLLRGW